MKSFCNVFKSCCSSSSMEENGTEPMPLPLPPHELPGKESQNEPTWGELLGSNNWEGLLDPLDLNLRRLILRCGDFCQATYDAFNNDANSKYAGTSRYGKSSFFRKVSLESASDYQVYGFLYATAKVDAVKALLLHSLSRDSWDRESNWIGYIAVTSDEVSRIRARREVYVVWRGTSRSYEWVNVLEARAVSAEELLRPQASDKEGQGEARVMEGWLSLYTSDDPNSKFTTLSARRQLHAKITEVMNKYKDEQLSITFTGHSLGATLSVLSSFDMVENGVVLDNVPVSAIVFGSPRVGNEAFNEKVVSFGNLKILHVRNKIDLIPLYPSRLLGFVDSGTDLVIDTRKSPSLKQSNFPGDWHNLQGMLHVVAYWNGEDGEFEMKVKRSLGLVNKSCGFLKEELMIPESWWVEKNKSMVLDGNGDWVLASPVDEDAPVPEY